MTREGSMWQAGSGIRGKFTNSIPWARAPAASSGVGDAVLLFTAQGLGLTTQGWGFSYLDTAEAQARNTIHFRPLGVKDESCPAHSHIPVYPCRFCPK